MELDLARAANQNATRGAVRATWSGGKLQIDETKFLDLVVRAAAVTMSANLSRGLTPDGSGPMPGRKKDGRPRGMGSGIARHLIAKQIGPLTWFIAAHLEIPGHLARIMQDVPLRAPPMDAIRAAVHQAFLAATKLAGVTSMLQEARAGGVTIDRSAKRLARGARQQFASALSTLGVRSRSRLASRLRKLGRRQAGGGR